MWLPVCLGEAMGGMEFHVSLGRTVYIPSFRIVKSFGVERGGQAMSRPHRNVRVQLSFCITKPPKP